MERLQFRRLVHVEGCDHLREESMVPCTTEAEPRRSVFRTQDVAPIVLKQAALLAEKLGLVGFSTVDSTIAALEGGLPKDPACPNSQCMVTETHLKQAYATEAQHGSALQWKNNPGSP
ncbi:UNVERIFIED_CONTAM: hypothetical protein FKN15_054397 [Acipenser sinensis]